MVASWSGPCAPIARLKKIQDPETRSKPKESPPFVHQVRQITPFSSNRNIFKKREGSVFVVRFVVTQADIIVRIV